MQDLKLELNQDILWPKINILLTDLSLAFAAIVAFISEMPDPFNNLTKYLMLLSLLSGGLAFITDSSRKFLVRIVVYSIGLLLYASLTGLLISKESYSLASLTIIDSSLCAYGISVALQLRHRMQTFEATCASTMNKIII